MRTKLLLLLIFIIAIFLFSSTLSCFFVQDDFFQFKMAEVEKAGDFFAFFLPGNKFGYRFYRPLTHQGFFFLGRSLFGLNPLGFRLIMTGFFLANIYLVYRLAEKMVSEKVGLIAGFLYAICSCHFTSLSYISTFGSIAVAFFIFLTIHFYLKEKKLAPIIFVLALLSWETAVTLPLVLLLAEMFGEKRWERLIIYFLIAAGYVAFRLSFFAFPKGDSYQMSLTVKSILNTLAWYVFWALGAPENMVDFVGSGFRPTERFNEVFGLSGKLIVAGAMLVLIAVGIRFFQLLLQKNNKQIRAEIIVFSGWFLIFLLPFLFWPQHKFAYYLEAPLFGFCVLISLAITKLPKLFAYLVFLSFITTSLLTVNFYRNNYWTVGRSKLAKELIDDLKVNFPDVQKGSIFYFKNDPEYKFISKEWGGSSSQAKIAISGCNAPQIIYGDKTLECFFEDDDSFSEDKEYSKEILPVVVKIN
ncbi:hypothetical protein C4578_03950 [Candidatus Microgenomates bacterium]|jgi:hypothetical protein|nr:MAG: hypothetical protein C4578_03950 [Candidatus Microgenomates bacterium]